MKQLTCEMCGGTNLLKEDGVFICQSCGCKYSIEEAKKLMIEGPVDVSGSTIKVDKSEELESLYQVARRARDSHNSSNAAKYYETILMKDPLSWEATFFTIYFQTMSCKIGEIRSAAISLTNCLEGVLGLIHDNVPADDQLAAIGTVVIYCSNAANVLKKNADSHHNSISADIRHQYAVEHMDQLISINAILYSCGDYIEKLYSKNTQIMESAIAAWSAGVAIAKIDAYVQKIDKYKCIADPVYKKKYLTDQQNQLLERKKYLESDIINRKEQMSIPYKNTAIISHTVLTILAILLFIIGFWGMSVIPEDWWISLGIFGGAGGFILYQVYLDKQDKIQSYRNGISLHSSAIRDAEKEIPEINKKLRKIRSELEQMDQT